MRHKKSYKIKASSCSHRKALIKNLIKALFIHERIKTRRSLAKAAKGHAEKLITWGKKGDLKNRRLSFSYLGDRSLVKRLFEEIAPRFKDTPGGYTRIINIPNRPGDNAKFVILELTKSKPKEKLKREEKEAPKGEKEPEEKPKVPTKPTPIKAPPKKFLGGLRRLFKRERDAL